MKLYEKYINEAKKYKIGSIIAYRTLNKKERTIEVTDINSDIKNGQSGFEGIELNTDKEVWGYDRDITKVIKK